MPEPINDAEAYGVTIVAADVAPGDEYWQVTRVHHRTPGENGGKHHIYLDALDEAGERQFGTRLLVRWDGGSQEVVIEKPLSEPGANFPMWKWQVCNVEALGMLSDRVENLHTGHDDEAPGNTLFHHSFDVTFQRTRAPEAEPPQASVIQGRVPGGAGHTLALLATDQELATAAVGADEGFSFTGLAAGSYLIRDRVDGRQVGPVAVDGRETVEVDFPQADTQPPPSSKPLARYFLFGPPASPATQLYLSLLADYLAAEELAFGFSPEDAAWAGQVTLVGDHDDAIWQTLQAAGCEVDQLPGQPGALLAAIRS